ncbi:MAG: recombinase family protein, partial [Defluviitaleaceae bacterium]|nr:recombinase family protein [Defluviitaleaceae bacterium]
NLDKGNQLEELLSRTFQTIEDIVSMETLTNAQLKQVVKKIVVSHDGNCDIYLHLFGDIGLDEAYLISDNQT